MNLHEYLKIEANLSNLDSYCILGDVPLWRIVRLDFRKKYLNINTKTVNRKYYVVTLAMNCLRSLFGIFTILLRRTHYSNLIIPHPRLFDVNGLYVDRLTDPIIDYSSVKESYLILERNQNGIHKRPRIHNENTIYLDWLDLSVCFFRVLLTPFMRIRYRHMVKLLYSELDNRFNLNDLSYQKLFFNVLSEFIIAYVLFRPLLKAISPRRVFLAPRTTFNYMIVSCKKNRIPVYELEHGITLGETVLYSGSYCAIIDPDLFLAFGRVNAGTHFGMPIEKVINIGWAYKEYVSRIQMPSKNNCVLVASSPVSSSRIVQATIDLALEYEDFQFHIRCHPQEKISVKDSVLIDGVPNVHIVDNNIESFLAIYSYDVVIGENSSVLFEAASMGKKVGRLNFDGLNAINSSITCGYFINTVDDFGAFIKGDIVNCDLEFYSKFVPEIVDRLS